MSPSRPSAVPGLDRATRLGRLVFLRPPHAGDQAEYHALRRASARHLRPWEPRRPPGADPYSTEAFRAYLRRSRGPEADYSLACSRETGAILGALHVSQIVGEPLLSAYLGYWCGAPHANRGVMTAALPLLLERVFLDLRLHRLEANVIPDNAPSLAVIRRAGFRREGFSPRYLKIAGRWRDHERWALTVEDWRRDRRARTRRKKA